MESGRIEPSSPGWQVPVWAEIMFLAVLPFAIYAASFSYNLLGLDDDLYYLHYPALHGGAWPGPVDVWKQPSPASTFQSPRPRCGSTWRCLDPIIGQGHAFTSYCGLWRGILAVRALVGRVTGRRDFGCGLRCFSRCIRCAASRCCGLHSGKTSSLRHSPSGAWNGISRCGRRRAIGARGCLAFRAGCCAGRRFFPKRRAYAFRRCWRFTRWSWARVLEEPAVGVDSIRD